MDRTISLREGLANKTFTEKLDYIWTYYKLHIFSILILIFFIGSYISAQVNRQHVYCNITYIGNAINAEELTPAKNKLNDLLLQNNKKSVINFDSIFTDDKSSSGLAMQQKLQVNITSQQIDIAIVNKEFFEQNFSSDMFLNLESLTGFSTLPVSNHELIKKTDSNDNNGTYGISIKNLNILNNIHFANNDNIIVVISNTEHRDAVVNVLKTFLT